MVDFDDIFPYLIGPIAGVIIFYGLATMIKKSIHQPADRQHTIDLKTQMQDQKWRMNDIRQRQKQIIRDQRDRIRDLKMR